jgi:hypothetical protein
MSRKLSLKRALSLGGSGKGTNNMLFLLGAAGVVALGVGFIMSHQHPHTTAKANFANSSNSIYIDEEGAGVDRYGNSMNSFVPSAGQATSTYLEPVMYDGERSFTDYTTISNSIPTPFLEVNFPRDAFNRGANLSNVIDKCAYVQTYNGNTFGGL